MYRSIMVPLDGSPFGEHALPLALTIARRAGATVDLVHVVTTVGRNVFGGELDAPVLGVPRLEQMRERAGAYLDQLAASLSARWDVAITSTVLNGPPADTLRARALASGVDLVVMTTHGRGPLSRAWLGSVADALIRQMPVPILLVRPHEEALDLLEAAHEQAFQHVLIPLDGSDLAEDVCEPAVALGELMQAEYSLLQAIDVPTLGYAPAAQVAGLDEQVLEQWRAEAQAYLDQVAEPMRARGLRVRTNVMFAQPALAILDYARQHAVDLIAMATHGRGGLARILLGSVADKVVRSTGTPVLLHRPCDEPGRSSAIGMMADVEDIDYED
jgi:nucleotide-binding universal stress UspA family protein